MRPGTGSGWSLSGNERSLAWIFGSSRSGSTWLLQMLGDLAGIATIDDPHLGHHLGVWRPISLAWACEEKPPPDLSVLPEVKRDREGYLFAERYRHAWAPSLRDLIAARFEAEVNDPDRGPGTASRAVVVKEPGSQVASLIMSLFPSSNLIFLLRDGRDVVDSWLDAYSHGSWALREGAFPVEDRDRLGFVRWQASVWLYRTEEVQRAHDALPEEARLLVRYEDLLDDPAPHLEAVARLVGLDASAEAIDEVARRRRFERLPEAVKGEGRRTRVAQPGAWRSNMSDREQEAMLQIIGPKLEELGYLRPAEPSNVDAVVQG